MHYVCIWSSARKIRHVYQNVLLLPEKFTEVDKFENSQPLQAMAFRSWLLRKKPGVRTDTMMNFLLSFLRARNFSFENIRVL